MSKRPRSQSRQMAADPAAANKRDPQQTQDELEPVGAKDQRENSEGPEFDTPRQKAHHEDEVVLHADGAEEIDDEDVDEDDTTTDDDDDE